MITLYTKPNCMQCMATKRYLDEHNARYTTIDVTQDEVALKHVKELGFQSLPVVESDCEVFNGFRPDKLKEMQQR